MVRSITESKTPLKERHTARRASTSRRARARGKSFRCRSTGSILTSLASGKKDEQLEDAVNIPSEDTFPDDVVHTAGKGGLIGKCGHRGNKGRHHILAEGGTGSIEAFEVLGVRGGDRVWF